MANHDIDTYLGFFNRNEGFSYKNRYQVNFAFPAAISGHEEFANLSCQAADMPGQRIQTTQQGSYHGAPVNIPYGKGIEEINFEFILDGNYKIKDAFEKWLDLIVTSNGVVAYKNDIIVNAWEIYQLDKFHNKMSGIRLLSVFPLQIGRMSFSDDGKMIQTMTVSISYEKREYIPVSNLEPR